MSGKFKIILSSIVLIIIIGAIVGYFAFKKEESPRKEYLEQDNKIEDVSLLLLEYNKEGEVTFEKEMKKSEMDETYLIKTEESEEWIEKDEKMQKIRNKHQLDVHIYTKEQNIKKGDYVTFTVLIENKGDKDYTFSTKNVCDRIVSIGTLDEVLSGIDDCENIESKQEIIIKGKEYMVYYINKIMSNDLDKEAFYIKTPFTYQSTVASDSKK